MSTSIQLPNGIVIIVSNYQIKSNFVMQNKKKKKTRNGVEFNNRRALVI